jgi:hypothetical protein
MSKDTKHKRRKKRYRERVKEIKSTAETMSAIGVSGARYEKEAIKRLHKQMNRRGGKYKTK